MVFKILVIRDSLFSCKYINVCLLIEQLWVIGIVIKPNCSEYLIINSYDWNFSMTDFTSEKFEVSPIKWIPILSGNHFALYSWEHFGAHEKSQAHSSLATHSPPNKCTLVWAPIPYRLGLEFGWNGTSPRSRYITTVIVWVPDDDDDYSSPVGTKPLSSSLSFSPCAAGTGYSLGHTHGQPAVSSEIVRVSESTRSVWKARIVQRNTHSQFGWVCFRRAKRRWSSYHSSVEIGWKASSVECCLISRSWIMWRSSGTHGWYLYRTFR